MPRNRSELNLIERRIQEKNKLYWDTKNPLMSAEITQVMLRVCLYIRKFPNTENAVWYTAERIAEIWKKNHIYKVKKNNRFQYTHRHILEIVNLICRTKNIDQATIRDFNFAMRANLEYENPNPNARGYRNTADKRRRRKLYQKKRRHNNVQSSSSTN